MKTIELKDHASLEAIAESMQSGEPFIIITDDKNFNPLGYDRHSADVWLGAAGGGTLMTIGAGALVLEPILKIER